MKGMWTSVQKCCQSIAFTSKSNEVRSSASKEPAPGEKRREGVCVREREGVLLEREKRGGVNQAAFKGKGRWGRGCVEPMRDSASVVSKIHSFRV